MARKKKIHYEVGVGNNHLGVFVNKKLVGNVVSCKKPGTSSVEMFQYVEVNGSRSRKLVDMFVEPEECMTHLEENRI